MSVQYRIDGRDPGALGYMNLNGFPDEDTRKKVVEALHSMGVADAQYTLIYLIGRLDDVYGWYLFTVGHRKYVILGDCLDVLEEPYDKVLTLDEVAKFAKEFGSGENIGTAYDAMKEWGVPFHELKEKMFDGNVWVLTMKKDGQSFPEVHKTFEGCVDRVIADVLAGVEQGDEKEYDFDKIRRELSEQMYWQDNHTDWEYDITECPLCNR